MGEQKICPLMSKQIMEGFRYTDCLEDKCAWWAGDINDYKQCSFLTIADALSSINQHLTPAYEPN